jgi:hypothetical protein
MQYSGDMGKILSSITTPVAQLHPDTLREGQLCRLGLERGFLTIFEAKELAEVIAHQKHRAAGDAMLAEAYKAACAGA